jgi:putative ABC transport system ATP-binding protein
MSNVPGTTDAIRVVDLVKTFDGEIIRALDGVNMTIKTSEFVAVTGPSGCGKSTLLHLIAALDSPSAGQILVNGRDLTRLADPDQYRRKEVGLVFQLHNLLPQLTALQNVEVAMFSNGQDHGLQRQHARELLAEVGLAGKERFEPTRLSGGERQRVAIARALANRPSILLADEPTGSLDSEAVEMLLSLLVRIRRENGVTIMLVTHDPTVAAAADRVIRMRDGKVAP